LLRSLSLSLLSVSLSLSPSPPPLLIVLQPGVTIHWTVKSNLKSLETLTLDLVCRSASSLLTSHETVLVWFP
jgi:hypothetical protein